MNGRDDHDARDRVPTSGSFTARDITAERAPDSQPEDARPSPAPATAPPDAPPSRLRTWAPRVGVALLVVVALASAAVSYLHGSQWQDRAEQAAAFAEQETSRADAAEELLVGSEEDVRSLEGQLAAVASDKEAATDQAQSVSIERDQFIALSAIAVQAADSLDTCVRSLYAGLNEAVRMWNTAVSTGYFGDAGYLNSYLNTVDRNCSGAQQANNELRGVVDAFVGS